MEQLFKKISIFLFIFTFAIIANAQVKIGGRPTVINPSALLETEELMIINQPKSLKMANFILGVNISSCNGVGNGKITL